MATIKSRKITKIVREFIKAGDSYDITGINLGLAKYLWRETQETFIDLATGDYRIDQSNGKQTLVIVNQELLGKAEAFQVGYVLDFTASPYDTEWNVDINQLKDKYNTLVNNMQSLWEYIRITGMIADDSTIDLILPQLDVDQIWVRGPQGYYALGISDFRDIAGEALSDYIAIEKKNINQINKDTVNSLTAFKENTIKDITNFVGRLETAVTTGTLELRELVDALKLEVTNYINLLLTDTDTKLDLIRAEIAKVPAKIVEIQAEGATQKTAVKTTGSLQVEKVNQEGNNMITQIQGVTQKSLEDIGALEGEIVGTGHKVIANLEEYLVNAENGGNAEYLQGYAPSNFDKVEETIASLQASRKYKLGEVVEVLGYYTAGDGAGHKRKIEATDDGSGVQLANGLWANIVHNGEVNVSWFGGLKGQSSYDDLPVLSRALQYKANKLILEGVAYVSNTIMVDMTNIGEIHFNLKCYPVQDSKFDVMMMFDNCHDKTTYGSIYLCGSTRDTGSSGSERQVNNGIIINRTNMLTLPETIFVRNFRIWGVTCANNAYADTSFGGFNTTFNNIKVRDCGAGQNNLSKVILKYTDYVVSGQDVNQTTTFTIENMPTYFTSLNFKGGMVIHIEAENLYYVVKNVNVQGNTIDVSPWVSQNLPKQGILRIIFGGAFLAYGANSANCVVNGTISAQRCGFVVNMSALYPPSINNIQSEANSIVLMDTSRPSDVSVGGTINQMYCEADEVNIFSVGSASNAFMLVNSLAPGGASSKILIQGIYHYRYGSIDNREDRFRIARYKGVGLNDSAGTMYRYQKFDKSSPTIIGSWYTSTIVLKVPDINSMEHKLGNDSLFEGETFIIAKPGSNITIKKPEGYTINGQDSDLVLSRSMFDSAGFLSNDYAFISVFYGNGIDVNYKSIYIKIARLTDLENIKTLSTLDTPYHTTKMQQEGVYNDFITYMDSKTEYDRLQREAEQQRQLTFEQSGMENYEEWLADQPMLLPVENEPHPSEALLKFKEKYLG